MANIKALKARLKKRLSITPTLLPTFYVTPYASSSPGQKNDYSLINYPMNTACDINLAFFGPDATGNKSDDTYLCSIRDRSAIQEFVACMKDLGRRIILSFIDSETIHWDGVNIENFVRNTEGEITPDGKILSNDLKNYQSDGRMWDAETPAIDAFAETMKACFLRGITINPENYIFVYTTYANRPIDEQILNIVFDATKSPVDAALIQLGFLRFSDLFTKRGPSLSWIETMSYSSDAASRFSEADTYANYLTLGDPTLLNDRRKYISIGVAPFLTSDTDASAIGAACDPAKTDGYGRFMVWSGNCPEGLRLFDLMLNARPSKEKELPKKQESWFRYTSRLFPCCSRDDDTLESKPKMYVKSGA